MFKEGDTVSLVHTVQGIYPAGSIKISNGKSNLIVEEKDLILIKREKLTKDKVFEFAGVFIAGAFFGLIFAIISLFF